MTTADFERQVTGVAVLSDPVRRSLYQYVVAQPDAVSRDEAAAAVGVQRTLAAFHLDKLADEGLLTFEFRRLSGRRGPGAGRPSKLYRRAPAQFEVSLPPREYDLAARLLAQAVEEAGRKGGDVRVILRRVARDAGRDIGRQTKERAGGKTSRKAVREALTAVLREHGFEPRLDDKDVVLGNCPFHVLAAEFTELVCGMNLALLEGLRSELDLASSELRPKLLPEAGQCCVRFCTG